MTASPIQCHIHPRGEHDWSRWEFVDRQRTYTSFLGLRTRTETITGQWRECSLCHYREWMRIGDLDNA